MITIASTTEKIKMMMASKSITQRDIADRMGISQPTLSKKFTLDNWRENDLRTIAEICGCSYKIIFELEDGTII